MLFYSRLQIGLEFFRSRWPHLCWHLPPNQFWTRSRWGKSLTLGRFSRYWRRYCCNELAGISMAELLCPDLTCHWSEETKFTHHSGWFGFASPACFITRDKFTHWTKKQWFLGYYHRVTGDKSFGIVDAFSNSIGNNRCLCDSCSGCAK